MDDKEKEKQKRIKEVAKHLHPHDDEPDPTAYMGNYNFPQMLFAFLLGFVTMFVLSINEIEKFKDVLYPHISMIHHIQLLVRHTMERLNRFGYSIFRIDCSSYYWYGYGA